MSIFKRFLICYFRVNSYYAFEFIMQFLRDGLMMYCVYALWSVLFAQGIAFPGATKTQVLVYVVYGAVVTTFVTRDGCQFYIRERIRQGTIDSDLLKPINMQTHMLMRDLSQKASKLIQITLPTLIIFILLTQLFFIPELYNFGLFIISVILSYGILFSINFLFGMLCFYTLSLENTQFAYTAVITFLSGQMVPLWIFPDWALRVVNVLPFRYIFDVPMSIFIGRLTFDQMLINIGYQFIWCVLLWWFGRLAWNGIRKHIISQGG